MDYVECCGLKLALPQLIQHRRSVWHQHAKTIRRLLASKYTYTEVAKQLGVSGERVRQLAKNLGITGRERRKQATLARHLSRWLDDPLVRSLPEGLETKPVRGRNRMRTRDVEINGHYCRLARYWLVSERGEHYSIRPVDGRYDFLLYFGPLGWLVFPWDSRPRSSTMFGIRPHISRGKRHDYLDYHERWDLLQKLGSGEPRKKRTAQ